MLNLILKVTLIKYEFKGFFPFGDGEYKTVYNLFVLHSYLFGLIRLENVIKYEISMFESFMEYEKHWDKLIKSGEKLK
jgi:hypothetical protein